MIDISKEKSPEPPIKRIISKSNIKILNRAQS